MRIQLRPSPCGLSWHLGGSGHRCPTLAACLQQSITAAYCAALQSSTASCCPCRKEATKDAAVEPVLSSFLYASILSHKTFGQSLAFILANRLSEPNMMATELIDIFHE